MIQKLENLIREKINLGSPNSAGWHSLKCAQCCDYKPRAGFRFDDGVIGYNCFNCGASGTYTEFSGRISRNFRKILNAYGLEDTEISSVVNSWFFSRKEPATISLESITKVNLATPTVSLPDKSFPLGDPKHLDYQEKLVAYLLKRRVNLTRYKFYFSLQERMYNRVIIPFYRNNSLIYWQARDIAEGKKRYDNAQVRREAVLFNFDQLYTYSNGPLFITEGVFDAMMLDGIAILGSKLTAAKVQLLQRTPRRIVFVIDKDENGKHLAEDVLKIGWEIAFTEDGTSDLNHSVQRFGLSYTIYSLMKSITKDPDTARLLINLNCR